MITWTIDDVMKALTKAKEMYGDIPILFYMERPINILPIRCVGEMHIVYEDEERPVTRAIALGAYPVPPCEGCALCRLH